MDKPTTCPSTNSCKEAQLVDPCKVQHGSSKPKHIAPLSSLLTGLTGMDKLRAAGLRMIPMPFDLKPLPVVPPRNPSHDPAKL